MANNLIMCLHSEAAETCAYTPRPLPLSYAHTNTHVHTLSISLFAISLPFTRLSSAQIKKGRALVSWCRARQWRSWEPCLPIWEMALGGDKQTDRTARLKPLPPLLLWYSNAASNRHATPTCTGLAKPLYPPTKNLYKYWCFCVCVGGTLVNMSPLSLLSPTETV